MKKASRPSNPLHEMASIFPLMVERAPIGILLVDDKGSIVHLNPKGQAIFGYTLEELVGKPMEILLPQRVRNVHVQHRAGFMVDPKARSMGEGRYLFGLHKEGREVPVEIGLVPLKTSQGMMVLATVMDITAIAENKQLEQDLLHVIEMEQKRIGQDLHDSLGQQLLAVSFLCNVLKKKLAAGTMPDPSEAAHIEDLLGEAKTNVRKLTRGLYAGDLEARGLGACLKEMTEHMQEMSSISCAFEGDATLVLTDRSKSENLFRMAQEALNNAVKHSLAKRIVVALQKEGSRLTLSVRDDGTGFAHGEAKNKGLGLRSMRYRSNAIGGTFEITTRPEGGTDVRCSVALS
jgi:two-component system, LuxR family, sensor kinase FixL